MNQRLILAVIALFFASGSLAGEYIVKQKSQKMMMFSGLVGLSVMETHSSAKLTKVHIEDSQEQEALKWLRQNDNVEYVVKNFKLRAITSPVEPMALKQQWANVKVNAEQAWQKAGNRGSKNVIVAVIDTGVDYNHESLRANMIPGYDFKDNDNDPMDIVGRNPGHGTHCTGSLGASGLADGGVIGLSPEVSVMPIRFLGADGGGDLMAGIKSIDYAIEKGARVISASWGAAVPRSQAKPLIEAVERADKAGVIFVVAAANDGKSNDRTDVFPANANTPNMISVAASGESDSKPSWSNYGKHSVDVAAPGNNIVSTLPNNKYGSLSGTSMATPLVSGVVALLLAQDSTLTGVEVRSLIQSTAAKVSIETACDCRVDAGAAMTALLDKKMYVVPYAETLAVGDTLSFSARNGVAPLTFASSDTQVATIDTNGMLTGVAKGETTVSVKDANGNQASSYKIYVGQSSGGGGGGGGGGDCPLGDPALCEALCQIMPDAPFCK
ncbi:MAG: S8 family serine peptidase [Bdellovibrionales bacterium]|nr:S8 family serine peptidase [Bdellovibrionales bacterium]